MRLTSSNVKAAYRIAMVVTFMIIGTSSYCQKYAYVDTQYMLDNIPDYKAAMQQLDQLSIQWQKEIEDKYAAIDKLYKAYQAEQILLTDEMKKKRQDEISSKEKDVKDLQKQHFGYEGESLKKKQELVKPIQDKIYNAVKTLATDANYAVIFDKAGATTLLYTNPKYDKSDQILQSMGYKAGIKKGSESNGNNKGTGSQGGGNSNQRVPPNKQ